MSIVRYPMLLAVVLLSACSSLLGVDRQSFTIYAPSYRAPAKTFREQTVDWQLAVETPASSDTLNTTRIVVMPSPGVIEVYPNARWSDPAPILLRNLIVYGFEQSGRIVGVGSAASGLKADYTLALDLHAFQSEIRGGTPHATLQFYARLLDSNSNRVLAAHAFEAERPFSPQDRSAAYAAFEATIGQAISQLVDWTLQVGTAAPKAHDITTSP